MNKKNAPWIVTAVAVMATVILILAGGQNTLAAHPHPVPRVDNPDLALSVMDASGYTNARVVRAYRIAETIPYVLDGLHCHCECRENFGHHSLFTCFQTNHGAQCDICIAQAELAATMTQRGDDLAAIRTATNEAYAYRYQ